MNNKTLFIASILTLALFACGKERTFIYNGPSFVAFDEASIRRDGNTSTSFIDSAVTTQEGNQTNNAITLRLVYAGKTLDENIKVNYSVRFIPDQVSSYFRVGNSSGGRGSTTFRANEHRADIVISYDGDNVRTSPLSRSVEITLEDAEPELVIGYPSPNPENNRNRKMIFTVFEDDAR